MQENEYKERIIQLKKEIREKEEELNKLLDDFSNIRFEYGKYKGLTYAEVAHKDLQYYMWAKNSGVIAEMSPEQHIYIMNKIQNRNMDEFIKDYEEMKKKQGYVGRYMI